MELVDGYSRMVQAGPFLYCGGTTSVQPDGSVNAEGDSYGQVSYVLKKLIEIIEKAGGCREDIYSVKIYATPEYNRAEGMRAFRELFQDVKPVLNEVTIYKLTRPTQLVEIEMNAIVGCSKGAAWEGISLKKESFPAECEDGKKYGYSSMVKIGPFVWLAAKSGNSDSEIIKKIESELDKVNVSLSDIVKMKRYATEAYEGIESFDYGSCLPVDTMAFSSVIVEKVNTEDADEKLETFAIIGSGGLEKSLEWGDINFSKISKVPGFVQSGPFIYAGTMHSLKEDGTVAGVGDSEIQESYVAEKLTLGLEQFGCKPEELVKFKGYYTEEFGPLYGETETPFYEKVYKPIKPLYTGVYVSRVGKKEEIFEMEMMAIKGITEE